MVNDSQYSNLIYEYFLVRFHSRYYKYGDTLPSIDILCREFNVSAQTVKVSLRRLRTEGYISMHNGMTTTVIFRQTRQEAADYILNYFSERWDTYFDLYASSELIFIPLLVEGLKRLDEEDLDVLSRLEERAEADDLIHFYCRVLQKMENPLALNLFWETPLFQGFPFARMEPHPIHFDTALVRQRLKNLRSLLSEGNWELIRNTLLEYQRSDVRVIMQNLEPILRSRPRPPQIPFVWRVYRSRPQICYHLASRILNDIYMGEYREMQFLPSYEKMAQLYGASVSTLRRTIRILNQAGVCRTLNGKGTRIFPLGTPCEPPDFESPAIRRNLSFFVQSFEILIYSCDGVTRSFLSSLSQDRIEELTGLLEECLNTRQGELSVWYYLIFVSQYSHLTGVREIYKTIYSLFLWGYPLKASSGNLTDLDCVIMHFTEAMVRHLKEHDYDQCAADVKELLFKQFPAARQYLIGHGIPPEELRISPSIRLFITDTEALECRPENRGGSPES